MGRCKSKVRFIPATCAWSLLLAATTLFFYFPCRAYLGRWYYIVPIYEGLLTAFVLINFSLATFMDPGIIPRAPPDEDRDDDFRAPLYKNVEINGITVRMKWCVTCQFYRPPRCSHCSVCDTCIETFDHHCPWVNNCIGRRNYRYFFLFLASLSLHMISIFGLCLNFILEQKDHLTRVDAIVSIVICGVVVLLFFPIFGLTGFHVILVSRGRTTNEQVTGKFHGGFNPFSRGCAQNCCYALCGPQFPSVVRWKKYVVKKKKRLALLNSAANHPMLTASPMGKVEQATNTTSVNQVKVYMDPSSNGMQGLSANAYNRMVASDLNEIEMEGLGMASQSADCEASPPSVLRTGKNPVQNLVGPPPKQDFFVALDASGAGNISYALREGQMMTPTSPTRNPVSNAIRGPYSKGSPHPPRHRMIPGNQMMARTGSMRTRNDQAMAMAMDQSPRTASRLHNRVKEMGGIPTPFAMSAQSPSLQHHRPDHIPVVSTIPNHLQQQQQYDMHYHQQRKVASEGQLFGEEQPNIDHLPELAGSPQRSIYTWREAAYPKFTTGSHPTSPSVNQDYYAVNYPQGRPPVPNVYRTIGTLPGSPQARRKQQPFSSSSDNSPSRFNNSGMTFSRALQMSDSLELSASRVGEPVGQRRDGLAQKSNDNTDHRRSVYEMNYEISV